MAFDCLIAAAGYSSGPAHPFPLGGTSPYKEQKRKFRRQHSLATNIGSASVGFFFFFWVLSLFTAYYTGFVGFVFLISSLLFFLLIVISLVAKGAEILYLSLLRLCKLKLWFRWIRLTAQMGWLVGLFLISLLFYIPLLPRTFVQLFNMNLYFFENAAILGS